MQVAEELPKEPKTLWAYADCLWSLLSAASIVSAYAHAMPPVIVSVRDRPTGRDYVQNFLAQVLGRGSARWPGLVVAMAVRV